MTETTNTPSDSATISKIVSKAIIKMELEARWGNTEAPTPPPSDVDLLIEKLQSSIDILQEAKEDHAAQVAFSRSLALEESRRLEEAESDMMFSHGELVSQTTIESVIQSVQS